MELIKPDSDQIDRYREGATDGGAMIPAQLAEEGGGALEL